MVVDGAWVFGAGVTAGIDGALRLTAELRGDETAQAAQLHMVFAPEPPFDRLIFSHVLPQTTFCVLNGVGHLSALEAPDRVAEACKGLWTDSKHRPTFDQLLCPRHLLFQHLRS